MTNAAELKAMAAAIDCTISESGAERLLAYLDTMLEENLHINLTSVREREDAVVLHALDSLALGSAVLGVEASSCLDLGTGNGFPGVAAACLFPDARVVLMDRTLRKLKAIERALVAAEFDTERVSTVHLNAIEAPGKGHASTYDLVTSRAVGDTRTVGHLARPMLITGGNYVCWMTPEQRLSNLPPKAFQKPRYFEYRLPAPAERERVLARFQR